MRQQEPINLADMARAAQGSLAKAQLLSQELCEGYFCLAAEPDEVLGQRRDFMLCEYRRAALLAQMLQDYLLAARDELGEISSFIDGIEL